MKKGIVAGLIVLCVALGAGTAAVVVTDDRKGPEIELPADGDVTYEEGSDTAPLLEGVTATDEKDGDVTDSLVIENIFPNDDHTSASVVYAAKSIISSWFKLLIRTAPFSRWKSMLLFKTRVPLRYLPCGITTRPPSADASSIAC